MDSSLIIMADGESSETCPDVHFTDEGDDCLITSPLPALVHHERVWFEDGNVVIVTDDCMAFKVHRTILASHSGVLRDMFTVPQPLYAPEHLYDGCPRVDVQGVSSEDLAVMLDMFYNGFP